MKSINEVEKEINRCKEILEHHKENMSNTTNQIIFDSNKEMKNQFITKIQTLEWVLKSNL